MTIEEIKTDLKAYCRERNICADGYADLLRAETPADLWAILKEHIIGMQSDLLCDYISEHLQAWYDAFGVKEGDKMYLPKSERLPLW
jgi:predicted metalloendopeptidase